MPRFMARLGGLAQEVWHDGGLYQERPPGDAAAVVLLRQPKAVDGTPIVEVKAMAAARSSLSHNNNANLLPLR